MLPVELLQRRGAADRCDLAVVGAGFAGLAVAAIAARAGARVVVVDPARRPGGEIQTLTHQGVAIDLGPTSWPAEPVARVLEAAGIDAGIQVRLPVARALRVVPAVGGSVLGDPVAFPVPGAVTSPAALDAVRALYGIPPRAFAALGETWMRLAALGVGEVDALVGTPLAGWPGLESVDAPVRPALRRALSLLGAANPDEADTAVVARLARGLLEAGDGSDLGMAGDHPVAGARCLVQSLVDALLEAGGELRLGTRVTGLGIERGRLRTLQVQREETPFVEEIATSRVVLAIPPRAIAPLAPVELLALLGAAPDDADEGGATLGVAWAFREAPLSRAGLRPDEPGLVRVVPELGGTSLRRSGGGLSPESCPVSLVWPSRLAPRVCPPGQALLVASVALPAADTRDAFLVSAHVARLRALVRDLFRGVDDLLEMERAWLRVPGAPDPLRRGPLPVVAPRLDGVFLAGAHVASDEAAGLGSAAASALDVTARLAALG